MEDLSIYRQFNLLYTQEKLARYRPGGYHPVCLGDTFKDGRYQIHHKLGWGGFSTVWLAKDGKHKQWVSIKIMTADSGKESRELRNLRSLARHSQDKYIVQLLDEFLHHGPNGCHQCLVFELLGPSLDKVITDYSNSGMRLEPEIVLRMSRQLLHALALMHDLGYAHGDLSVGNLVFTCNDLLQLTENELLEALGPPKSEELARRDGKPLDNGLPNQLVKATGWDDWFDEDDEDLRIIDLGESFLQGVEPKRLAQPIGLQVPEIIFTGSFDYRVDLWRAGLVIYSLIFGSDPFQYLGGVEELVGRMIDFVEKLPTEWLPEWDRMRLNSKRALNLPTGNDQLSRSRLEQKFDDRVHDQSLKPLLPVIKGLMRFLPQDRISASQALDLIPSETAKMNGWEKEWEKDGRLRPFV